MKKTERNDYSMDTDAMTPSELQQMIRNLRADVQSLSLQNEELLRTKADLHSGQLHYFDLFDNAPMSLLVVSATGKILEANHKASVMLGVQQSDLIQSDFFQFVWSEDQAIYFEHKKMLIKTREPQSCELRMVTMNGTLFWAQILSAFAQTDGSEHACRIVISDIEDRKLAEEALKDSNDLYNLITDNVNDMISKHALDGTYTFLSPSCKKILGYDPKELIGKNPYDLFHPDSQALIRKTHDTILHSSDIAVTTYQIRRKNGTYAWLETTNKTIVDTVTRQPAAILSISRDISVMKDEEDLFHKMIDFSEELLKTGPEQVTYQKILENFLFLSNAKYGALTLFDDQTGKFTTVAAAGMKRAAKKITSLIGFELIGKKWDDYTTENVRLEGQKVTVFSSMTDLADSVIPTPVTRAIDKLLRIGDTIVTKVIVDHTMIGDFTLIMPIYKKMTNSYFVEIYSREVDVFIARRKEMDVLKASEEKYRLITEHASDVIWIFNMTLGKMTYMSPSILNLRGITVEEALVEDPNDTLTPDSLTYVNKVMEKRLTALMKDKLAPNYYVDEIQQTRKDGSVVSVEAVTKYSFNKKGEVEILGVSRNIDERKKSEQEVLYLSYHDQLTGLYNRRFYEEEMHRLDTERNLPMSIAMGDVNGLKLINDSFGHDVGDDLLRKVADILRNACRAEDIIARLGGDEFVILFPKTDADGAEKVIKRIKDLALKEKVGSVDVSISFGYETKYRKEENIQDIFRRTEDHMYRNKLSDGSSMRSHTIDLIMNTLFEKNSREMQHSKRVSEICQAIASKMFFSKEDMDQIRIAGLMHDIGKIGIDEKILNKSQKLQPDEWKKIQKHSEIGYRILSSANEFSEIADFILEHHERWNGKGYPRGLSGVEISMQARIIAVADSYDAMTSTRTYRTAFTEDEAIREIERCSGVQFDPNVARVFVEEVMGRKWESPDA